MQVLAVKCDSIQWSDGIIGYHLAAKWLMRFGIMGE